MSGGHFGDYDYYKVQQFADELEEEIWNNDKVIVNYGGHNHYCAVGISNGKSSLE